MTTHADEQYRQFVFDCAVVSNESFSIVPGMMKRSFNRLIGNSRDVLRHMTTWDFTRPEVLNTTQVKSALSRLEFMSLDEFFVDTPVGFNATDNELASYIDVLTTEHQAMINVFADIDKHAEKILGAYISEPELFDEPLNHEWKEKFNDPAGRMPDITALKQFLTNDREHLAPFTKVFASNNECVSACSKLNTLNQSRWAHLNPKVVQRRIDRINKLVTTLLMNIEKQNKPSVPHVEFLMNLVLFCANWTRQYGVLSAMIIDTTTALKHTERKIINY